MLPKQNRIKKKKDFELIFKNGKTFKNNFFILKILENNLEISRFAIVASLKFSKKAVERNRIRRQISAVLERSFGDIKKGVDVVFVVLPQVKNIEFFELEKSVEDVLQKAKVI